MMCSVGYIQHNYYAIIFRDNVTDFGFTIQFSPKATPFDSFELKKDILLIFRLLSKYTVILCSYL